MDRLLQMFFDTERWATAIEKGVIKDINKGELRKLTTPQIRIDMYNLIKNGQYAICPPHTAQIPKDTPGEFRTVYINENADRILLSILNDMLFEIMPECISDRCKSYQKGIGCGKVVQEVSRNICNTKGNIVGWKSDLSKYFDSVPIKYIDEAFDMVEKKFGKSKLIDVVRNYYHCDLYYDENKELCTKYQSLKQGCAVASWLADVILYELDEEMKKLNGYYCRYSDDCLFIGKDYEKAMQIMVDFLAKKELKLNPKKVEYISPYRWFKFLGFNIQGSKISLSKSRVKKFQKEIYSRTKKANKNNVVKIVNNYLYCGEYSWASSVLPIINVKEDIDTLNEYVMDSIRIAMIRKPNHITTPKEIGGIGVKMECKDHCLERVNGGTRVRTARERTEYEVKNYYSLWCMRDKLITCKNLYDTFVREM